MNHTVEQVESLVSNSKTKREGFNFKKYSVLIALLVLFVALAIITEGSFLNARNFTNLSRQISINGVLAVGMTLVILTAGIDLSVGSVVAFSGVVAGLLQVHAGLAGMGVTGTALSVIACIMTGICCGLFNGGLISVFRIPPFVISLGMMVMAAGGALIISNSQAISPLSPSYKWIAKGFVSPTLTGALFSVIALFWVKSLAERVRKLKPGAFVSTFILESAVVIFPLYCFVTDRGLPMPTMILLVIAAITIWMLKNTTFGRYIYAIGGNEEAAKLSGIPVVRVKWAVYAIMGLLAGISGVVLSARLNSASPTVGTLMELDAIAAVVIGGTSLMGGIGTVGGSIIGAFLIGTLNNGMDLMDINSNYQMVIKGMIIIFAVWSDSKTKARA